MKHFPLTVSRILTLLLAFMMLNSCEKEKEVTIEEGYGQLIDGGSPALDGAGFYIRLQGTGASEDPMASQRDVAPANLPKSYQQPGINIPVRVKFYYTGERGYSPIGLSSGLPIVHFLDIEKQ